MKDYIIIAHEDKIAHIPNQWELLTTEQYLYLHTLLIKFAKGEITAGMVKVLYLCHVMKWNIDKIKGEETLCNIVSIAQQITFIFNIAYPESVYEAFEPEEIEPYKKKDPTTSTSAIGRYLAKTEFKYTVDSCFCAQKIPTIKIGKKEFKSYTINTDFSQLTTSLLAIQFIEARTLAGASTEYLPLLASILYSQGTYDSKVVHQQANQFKKLPEDTLSAIALNFIAFINYLFKKTEFNLLTAGTKESSSNFSVGPSETLYNLSLEGYGTLEDVKKMNLIEYLQLSRKKTIDVIKSMHAAKRQMHEIANETGLPIHLVNKILQ